MSVTSLRRTFLFTPGNRPERLAKAAGLACDAVIFDLEDAVPMAAIEKEAARTAATEALSTLEFGTRERGVRINPLSGPYGRGDLLAVVAAPLDWVVLPKCEDAAQVTQVAQILQAAGCGAGIIPMVETAKGLVNAEAIAAAPRVAALFFGAHDFSVDIGAELDGQALLYARSRVVVAARAAGVDPIDSPYAQIDDPVGLVQEAVQARRLGFAGKQVIHPSQIGPVNQAFTPDPSQVAWAQRIVDTYSQAEAAGLGAVAAGGEMIDAPVVARARQILAADGATKESSGHAE